MLTTDCSVSPVCTPTGQIINDSKHSCGWLTRCLYVLNTSAIVFCLENKNRGEKGVEVSNSSSNGKNYLHPYSRPLLIMFCDSNRYGVVPTDSYFYQLEKQLTNQSFVGKINRCHLSGKLTKQY